MSDLELTRQVLVCEIITLNKLLNEELSRLRSGGTIRMITHGISSTTKADLGTATADKLVAMRDQLRTTLAATVAEMSEVALRSAASSARRARS